MIRIAPKSVETKQKLLFSSSTAFLAYVIDYQKEKNSYNVFFIDYSIKSCWWRIQIIRTHIQKIYEINFSEIKIYMEAMDYSWKAWKILCCYDSDIYLVYMILETSIWMEEYGISTLKYDFLIISITTVFFLFSIIFVTCRIIHLHFKQTVVLIYVQNH